ncbi:MAG TPA: hypothetical protein VI814_14250 [Candidatus Limnocylindria bacterium]
MLRLVIAIVVIVTLPLATASAARADDGVRFHRTTPRAVLADARDVVVIGVPSGRAWGIESELRPLPDAGAVLVVRLAVSDPAVREAFVRVAYYGTASSRSRQIAISDSAPVAGGRHAFVAIELDPPAGAVAYRVRVLARLSAATGRSTDDAVTAALHFGGRSASRGGSLYSRLLP